MCRYNMVRRQDTGQNHCSFHDMLVSLIIGIFYIFYTYKCSKEALCDLDVSINDMIFPGYHIIF